MFEVRIHCIDYCLAAPTDADRTASRAPLRKDRQQQQQQQQQQQPDTAASRVPIIRVFGATSGGDMACAHIHGVFPYLLVPYDTHFALSAFDRVVASLRQGIDQAVGRPVVLAITFVRGVPFYGFHVGLRLFLKIYLLDPAVVSRVAEMLRQGRFAGLPPLLPHEAHVPFLLQFMTDYNLYGCDILRADTATRRSCTGRGSCPVEVDIAACHIRNRDAVLERSQHESIPETLVKTGERLVYSMASLWCEVAGKYNKKSAKTAEERRAWELASTQEAFAQLAASSSDPRRTPSAWPHDAEYHKHIADMIAVEDASQTAVRPRDPLEEAVQTMRQSVEDFYPPEERFEGRKRKRQFDGRGLPVEKEIRLSPSPEPRVVAEKREPQRERPLTQTFSVVKSASPRDREKPRSAGTVSLPSSLGQIPSTAETVVDRKPERISHANNTFAKDAVALGKEVPETTNKWKFARLPPSCEDVEAWLTEDDARQKTEETKREQSRDAVRRHLSEKRMPKKTREAGRKTKPQIRREMSVLVLEMHANSRENFLPNPERDAVQCVVWRAAGATGVLDSGTILVRRTVGKEFGDTLYVDVVADEQELLQRVVQLVHQLDPDILSGYEIAAASWGYLQERAELYEEDLWAQLGRVEQPREAALHERGQCVTGRHMLAIGEALRASVDLRQYTLENTAWEVLGQRVPAYTAQVLTEWVAGGRARALGRAVRHYRRRAAVGMALLEATDLVAQTCEQARVLGVDFASVLGRGSQFKVESVMLRLAKPENYVLPSPSHEQVGQQKAAEVAPLVLEPRSALYSSPVVVLDFASLYPSLMIAYNLCYSTYVGRADETSQKGSKMGFTTYSRPSGLLGQLSRSTTRPGLVVTPTGTMFVAAQTRQSLLAKMLSEILNTRVMVKTALRTAKNAAGGIDAGEQRRLHNRQLALKLLANVTYGYTSASFSGRMPCVELADSIVETGRQTLDRAIALIHAEPRWAAEVVYGDTDSLFVHLPGRTREQAFVLGAEMAEAVTASNPRPVRLKLEKVYQPCILLAKKRYVGNQFETATQTEPVLDAKGIETVRRDGSPAASRLLEDVLRLLFDDPTDLDRVKTCVQTRLDDVLQDRLSPVDFCFSRHVRGGPDAYHAPPPGALLAARRAAQDPRAALLTTGERVPFVVVAGPPGVPLRDRCVPPQELVKSRHLRLDADYYIRRSLLPPLDRILRLVGVDVARWYADMPRMRMPLRIGDPAPTQPQLELPTTKQPTLDTWLHESQCARCEKPVKRVQQGDGLPPPLCRSCADDPHTLAVLQCRLRDAEVTYRAVLDDCRRCAGVGPHDEMRCTNLTCTRYFVRVDHAVKARIEQAKAPLTALLSERAMRDLQW